MKLFINVLISITAIVARHAIAVPLDIEEDPELNDGYFEGDIELSISEDNLLRNETFLWPDAKVYFSFGDIFTPQHLNYILRAMHAIEKISCIRFHPADENSTNSYINITATPDGCHSIIGHKGGVQNLNFQRYPPNSGCFRVGTLMHEFLHSLGFHHQQSSSNRDDYVKIEEENIKTGKLHNFQKQTNETVTDFGIEYDYGSIMHYSVRAFTKNGKDTIIPLKNTTLEIGQRHGMSPTDIAKLNQLYKCNEIEKKCSMMKF